MKIVKNKITLEHLYLTISPFTQWDTNRTKVFDVNKGCLADK